MFDEAEHKSLQFIRSYMLIHRMHTNFSYIHILETSCLGHFVWKLIQESTTTTTSTRPLLNVRS